MEAMACTIVHCRAAHWPTQPPRRHRRRRCLGPTRAGLLDMFKGGGAAPQLDVDAEGEQLKEWMIQRGLPPQQLAAVAVPGAGRGLAATQPIGKGEALLRVPRSLIVTPAAAAAQSALLRELLEAHPLPAWSVLALWLAEARAQGPSSEWHPYLRLLPDRTGCVLEWSEEEVAWLESSELQAVAEEIRDAAEASWREMQPLLEAAAQRGLAPPGALTREHLQWAFSMLLSRLVRLPSLGAADGGGGGGASSASGTEALVPFADLLNHSTACTSFLDWDTAEAVVVLRADRRYKAGEEVSVSYGQKTSGELLLSYGFCPAPGSNPHDGCQLRLELRRDDPARAWKAAALARHGFAAEGQRFPLRMTAAPFELVHYAALSVADVSTAEEADALAQRLFAADDMPPPLQQPALEAVVRACQAAQAAYPRSMDADRAELEGLREGAAAGGGGSGGGGGEEAERRRRRADVLQVLVHERQVLARTLFVLQQELKDLRKRVLRAAT